MLEPARLLRPPPSPRGRLLGALGALVLLAAALGATLAGRAAAQAVPGFVTAAVFSPEGLAVVVFPGGSLEDLEASARSVGATGVWVQDGGGRFQLLVVDGPAFLKDRLRGALTTPLPLMPVTLSGGRGGSMVSPIAALAPPALPTATPAPTPTPPPTVAADCTSLVIRANPHSGDIFVAADPPNAAVTMTLIQDSSSTLYTGDLPMAATPATRLTRAGGGAANFGRVLPAAIHRATLQTGTNIAARCGSLVEAMDVTEIVVDLVSADRDTVLIHSGPVVGIDMMLITRDGFRSVGAVGQTVGTGALHLPMLYIADLQPGDVVIALTPYTQGVRSASFAVGVAAITN